MVAYLGAEMDCYYFKEVSGQQNEAVGGCAVVDFE